jgi:hypothetical protein
MPIQPDFITRVTAAISSPQKFGRPKGKYSERGDMDEVNEAFVGWWEGKFPKTGF